MKVRSAYEEDQEEEMPHMDDGGILGGLGNDFDGPESDTDTVHKISAPPPAAPMPSPSPAPMAPRPMPPAAAAPLAPAAPAPRPMPGMPPSVTPDALHAMLNQQRGQINKYSPDQQYGQEMAMLKARNSPGAALAHAAATFAGPEYAQSQDKRWEDLAAGSAGAMERARKGNMENVEANQKIDAQDAGSPLSQAYQKAFGSIFAKMGYDPKSVSSMPASQISNVADLGVRYADAQTQLELKKAMLQVQTMTAMATMANQQGERAQKEKEIKKSAAEETLKGSKIPFVGPSHAQKQDAAQVIAKMATGEEGGGAATGPLGPVTQRNGKTYEWSPSTGKYHLKNE